MLFATALVAGAVVLLAGCGAAQPRSAGVIDTDWFSATPVAEILSAAAEASTQATSFHVEDQVRTPGGVLRSSLSVVVGGDCTGRLQLPAWGRPADLVVADGEGAFRGDRLFWFTFDAGTELDLTRRVDLVERYAERWTTTPGLAGLCEAKQIWRPVVKASRNDDAVKEGLGDVDGVPAGRVATMRGKARVQLWIALSEPHRVLQVSVVRRDDPVPLGADGDSITTFSGFDEPVGVDFPADDEIETFELPAAPEVDLVLEP